MNTTQYQPRNGDRRGPVFCSMTAASCWVILAPNPHEWTVELVRSPINVPDDEDDEPAEPFRLRTYLDLSGCCEARDLDP